MIEGPVLDIGDTVYADGGADLHMIVTALTFRSNNYIVVECSYFINSESKVVWIEKWRLEKVIK